MTFSLPSPLSLLIIKGEVHSKMSILFLSINRKFMRRTAFNHNFKLSNFVKSLLKIHTCRPPSWIIRDVIEFMWSLFSLKCARRERCFVRLTYLSNLCCWTKRHDWNTKRNPDSFVCSSFPQNFRLSSMTSRIIQDGGPAANGVFLTRISQG